MVGRALPCPGRSTARRSFGGAVVASAHKDHVEDHVEDPHSASRRRDEEARHRAQQLASAFLGGVFGAAIFVASPLGQTLPSAVATNRVGVEEVSTIRLFQRSTPSVVFITNLATRRDAFTLNTLDIPQGAGSGFVWDKEGHIVTNYHVIRGASDVRVSLSGGDDYPAKVVGVDEDKDIAVLQITLPPLPAVVPPPPPPQPLRLGHSSDLQVGQRVFAIGNPFGLDHTLTTGVISGIGREISSGTTGRPIQGVIQTDAAINPGNSGGPLLDSSGSLIGINTAIYSPSGANTGVGFAIPVDVVRSSVEQIIKNGRVVRPIMGISFAPDASVEQLGVSGVLVLEAKQGGPAALAGVKGTSRDEYGRLVLGDIILAVDGKKIKNASDLYRVLDTAKVGDKLDVKVLRGNEQCDLFVVLQPSSD